MLISELVDAKTSVFQKETICYVLKDDASIYKRKLFQRKIAILNRATSTTSKPCLWWQITGPGLQFTD